MFSDMTLFVVFAVVLIAIALPLGRYMTNVFFGENKIVGKFFLPIERIFYRLAGVNEKTEMNWRQYATALILFNVFGAVFLFLIQLSQQALPLNPQNFGSVETWHLALNTAISFITNTNWQAYGGESTLSYFTQMTGLTVQNFLSAATGCAVAVAFIRGLTRKSTHLIGNFWLDLVRFTVRVLLPISIVLTLFFVQQGVIQNFDTYQTVQTLEGAEQTIAMGPVASQESIKMLGTNGGGFFNANSAHPFENPTPLTNFVQMLAIFIIPLALVFMFGNVTKNKKQGYAIAGAMFLMFFIMLGVNYSSEINGNPIIDQMNISEPTSFEGKEVRFGMGSSSLFTTITTAASCGAVNNMHDSLTPLGGLVPLLQMMLGEIVFGGVGAGFYGIMVYVLITVFIVGLMVGRTPEYLGKKIEAKEMKFVMLALLIPSVTILLFSAAASVSDAGLAGLNNDGPHGLSEILYAFTSGTANNGSAFAGLTANTVFYDLSLSVAMLLGRFGVIVPLLAVAGSMAEKKIAPSGLGTFETTGFTFMILLAGIVFIIGALTFLPALALGPIVEQVLMIQGITF
ncbi:K+-transporting ATPase ATPase A chain [Propionispira arboris]|uniref:Potassium-transporting ATPase potassium-binding subunit n=1 Tax=Propionispira arboris TaxID=84035 RepID=A0A1H6YKC8_9FIRM|nr:potassium-transporting ATPase subunit KdpA [Propionispira arboris]SEJ41741.1 K+-transporting ATPase ATPase A chain [Propionispira arboris]